MNEIAEVFCLFAIYGTGIYMGWLFWGVSARPKQPTMSPDVVRVIEAAKRHMEDLLEDPHRAINGTEAALKDALDNLSAPTPPTPSPPPPTVQ